MKLLHPQRLRPLYYEPVEQTLRNYWNSVIFKPLITILKEGTNQNIRLNANTRKIEQALSSGTLQYTDGIFSGKFNASIGKELRSIGADFDWRSKVYRIDPSVVPVSIIDAAKIAENRAQLTHDAMRRRLDEIQANIGETEESLKVPGDYVVGQVYKDFQAAARTIIVTPELSISGKKALVDNYNKSLLLPIRSWSQKAINRLRSEVEANSLEGYRYDELIRRIQDEYSATQSKAKFLARQETSLFMAKYRQETFAEVGVNVYKWSARSPNLTRPDHWRLNGRFFRYSEPPVTNVATGARNNPGADFGCLCVDIPAVGYIGKIGE